jgi:thiamine pyrophosphokinase
LTFALEPLAAVVVANGTLPSEPILAQVLSAAGYVLAADGGANGLADRGYTCDAILGDFDSVRSDVFPNTPRIPAPDQNFTDLDKAIAYLVEKHLSPIAIIGATGTRLDHTFSALSVLIRWGPITDVSMIDEIGVSRYVNGDIRLNTRPDQTVSLLPINGPVRLSTQGLRWELKNEQLEAGVRDGTSNVATGSSVMINIVRGDLIVYVHH